MGLEPHAFIQMLRAIVGVHARELTCDECMAQIDRYAELQLAGAQPELTLPQVRDHLSICRDCREEYDGLLTAMRALLL